MTSVVSTGSADAAAGAPPRPAAGAFPPLKVREKLVYAAGDVAEGGINYALATFLLFFLTAVCGLPGTLAGLALSLSLMIDAVLDPIIGYVSDNTRSRWGRRHPFLIGASLPLAICVGLIFSLPAGLSTMGLFAYLLGLLLVKRVLQSMFFLSYGAMGAELSRDYEERSSITAFRSILSSVGALIALSLGYGLFLKGDAALVDRGAYVAYGWTAAAVLFGFMLICGFGTLPLRGRLHGASATDAPSPGRFLRDVVDAAKNRSFVILFVSIVIFWVATGTARALGLHAYKYFWEASTAFLATVPLLTIAGALTGVPLAAFALKRLEKQQVCVAGVILYCVNQATPVVLHLLGVTPDAGAGLFALLSGMLILEMWALAAIGVSFFSMLADCADEHEHLFGARREALFFAGTQFSTKAAIALGSLFAGVGLDLIGFPGDIAKLGPNPVLPVDTVRGLGLIVGPGAAALAVTCAFVLARYSLNARRVADIQAELTRRRG